MPKVTIYTTVYKEVSMSRQDYETYLALTSKFTEITNQDNTTINSIASKYVENVYPHSLTEFRLND